MKTVEELRERLIAWAQKETSEDKLNYMLYQAEHPDADLPRLTEREEAALERGMADYLAGRTIPAEEVWANLNRRREERRASQRNAG